MGPCTSTMTTGHRTGWIHRQEERGLFRRSSSRCIAAVREKRSRFYIVRKCIVMLVFWHKYGKI
ncbi:DVL-like protein [Cynara cardunculus var. scolymus]|uniref:DVL-like protein n=1 Tax=Cynara cardunculus var. scolymus TaxID=59895 RepID=A0A103Y5N0_CYNCS|nr:DVL-like protein [Cynara cardunculus var. scolymus]